jgi:hypothetical protein
VAATGFEDRSRNEIRTPFSESKKARLGATEELFSLTGPRDREPAGEIKAARATAVSVARVRVG